MITAEMRILSYHSIKEEPRARYVTARRDLRAFLDDCGRRNDPVISLSDMEGPGVLRRSSIMLTFDDGYLDNYTTLFPILEARRLPALIFLVVGRVGRKNNWDVGSELAGEPLLGWEQIEEMSAAGVLFGSHGMTHADLRTTDEAGLEFEVRESKRVIEDRLGKPVEAFAYPFGRFDERILSAVGHGGYRYAMTVGSGRVTTRSNRRLALSRVEIRANEPLWKTRARIRGWWKPKDVYHAATGIVEKAISTRLESWRARR
jgi:peptidoglycan/xylan/chitin deacetylase (PgdA/CDA1 family)